MRWLLIIFLLLFIVSVQAQSSFDLEELEVISIDNIQDLVLLAEYTVEDILPQYSHIQEFRINADSTHIFIQSAGTIISYVDLQNSKITHQYEVNGSTYSMVAHPTKPNLVLLDGWLIDIETNEIRSDYPYGTKLFTKDGQYVATATTLSDAETGEVVEQWLENYEPDEYPKRGYWDFDMSATGEVIGLVGVFERANCCPYSIPIVDIVKDFDELITLDIAPYDNEYEQIIRVSNDGKWIAYLASDISNNERFTGIVVYSLDDIENPYITYFLDFDFEFDKNSTILVGDRFALDLKSLEMLKLTIPFFLTVEFSYDGKLMVTSDLEMLQIWGVPVSD